MHEIRFLEDDQNMVLIHVNVPFCFPFFTAELVSKSLIYPVTQMNIRGFHEQYECLSNK